MGSIIRRGFPYFPIQRIGKYGTLGPCGDRCMRQETALPLALALVCLAAAIIGIAGARADAGLAERHRRLVDIWGLSMVPPIGLSPAGAPLEPMDPEPGLPPIPRMPMAWDETPPPPPFGALAAPAFPGHEHPPLSLPRPSALDDWQGWKDSVLHSGSNR